MSEELRVSVINSNKQDQTIMKSWYKISEQLSVMTSNIHMNIHKKTKQ